MIDLKKDDNYNPNKKRELIKNILIIFLAILLVLTFFSNTIMNRSLAEVSTERATSGKLTERIRGSGMVESNQSYEVKVDYNRVVEKVMVKSGKTVKKGDVLFTVGTGESEELTAAEELVESLELEYQKALLNPPNDYTSENQAIKNAREDLAEAIRKRNEVAANEQNVENAKEDYKYNKSQLNSYTKLQTKLSAVIMAIDSDDYMSAPIEYTNDLVTLKNALTNAENAYNTAYGFYMALVSGESDEEDETETETKTLTVNATAEEIESAKADMEAKKTTLDNAREEYENLKSVLRKEYAAQLSDAEYYIDYYGELVEEYESGGSGDNMTVEALDEEIKSKERALEEMINALNQTMKDDDTQSQITSLDLESKRKEIDKAKKKVEKLKSTVETTEIKSEHDGVVSSVNIKAGETTVPEMELITIDISDEGYTVKITVDGEKTKAIKKGVEAEIVNNWSGGMQAVLTDMKNDTTAGSKNRILVFTVTGSVDSGSYLDLSIPCGSGNYDVIVPKNAVHEDNNGKFVLVVQSKSSPLGNRYYAKRVSVDVIASDEVSSAVSGSLTSSDYVLTASSAPVKAGDQVRMQEK